MKKNCNYSKEEYEYFKSMLPDDFFTRTRPHMTKPELKEDMIPFKWPKSVLKGKVKAIVVDGYDNWYNKIFMKNKNIISTVFFNKERKIISMKESLKDIIPVNWDETLIDRKNNDKQIIILKK